MSTEQLKDAAGNPDEVFRITQKFIFVPLGGGGLSRGWGVGEAFAYCKENSLLQRSA